MNAPSWLSAISWSTPMTLEALRANRAAIPHRSGVYVFTNYSTPLVLGTGVLYVGKATSLNKRVQSYLVDPATMYVMSQRSGGQRLNSSLRHPGKVLLLVEIQQKSRGAGLTGIWIRWAQAAAPVIVEQQLIHYFQPAFNTQGRDWDD